MRCDVEVSNGEKYARDSKTCQQRRSNNVAEHCKALQISAISSGNTAKHSKHHTTVPLVVFVVVLAVAVLVLVVVVVVIVIVEAAVLVIVVAFLLDAARF